MSIARHGVLGDGTLIFDSAWCLTRRLEPNMRENFTPVCTIIYNTRMGMIRILIRWTSKLPVSWKRIPGAEYLRQYLSLIGIHGTRESTDTQFSNSYVYKCLGSIRAEFSRADPQSNRIMKFVITSKHASYEPPSRNRKRC